ncbi:GH3 auxin-responsive promoter family protein [Chloroflexota bacterium]
MSNMLKLLQRGREDELWRLCCGFLDLKLPQFMTIQKRLLMEQIHLLAKCPLGARLFSGVIPRTVEEFRQRVPFTTYKDYCPDLLERRVDVLPVKPVMWQHTSGRTGEYRYKWVPLTARYCREVAELLLGMAILSGSREWGDVTKLREDLKMIYAVAPRPYTSGTLIHILQQEFPIACLPSLKEAEAMSFEERLDKGFGQALSVGLDGFGGLALALVAIGERFRTEGNKTSLNSLLLRPKALWRVGNALLKSSIARRNLLPRDLWAVKGITSSGTDSSLLKNRIKEIWGRYPLDAYICTEGCIIATQTWDYKGMTFIPNLNFLEFIPERESSNSHSDSHYIPSALLLDEVKPGEVYEMVITNFHGGALVRYRLGDMVRITATRNNELHIDIPQMNFERRSDDLIDLGGFVRLTERTIWQAIENTGVPYEDWVARKEVSEKPLLHLYIQLKNGASGLESDLAATIYSEMKKLDERINASSIYDSLQSMVGGIPVKVHLLKTGAFENYIQNQRARGADLAHLKPPHVNPSREIVSILEGGNETGDTNKSQT